MTPGIASRLDSGIASGTLTGMTVTYMQAPAEGSRVSAAGTCACGTPLWAFGDTKDEARAQLVANAAAHIRTGH